MAEIQANAFMRRVGIPLAYILLRFYLTLIRIRVVNEDPLLNHLKKGGKGIAAIWHQRFFGAIGYAKKFSTLAPSLIISQSRDGELISQMVSRFGFRPIRGSSSRGGKEALAAIVQDLSQNQAAVHAVDGPLGPKGVVKAGLIRMAQLSQAAIFLVYISIDRAWILHSWDRFLIPKPFSRMLVRWSDPIFVQREMDPETFEALRLEVEDKMTRGHAQDDHNWGWVKPL